MQTAQPPERTNRGNVRLPEIPMQHGADAANDEPRQNMLVWQWPVRLTHWVTVLSIGLLTVTGIYIASPFLGTTGDASGQYLMGTVRFLHLITAFAFTISVLFRLYWLFVGNKWANWRQFVPVQAARRRGIVRMLGFYVFIRKQAPAVIGHNPLAGLAYTVIFVLFLLQIGTGFALYALPFHDGIWPALFGWITLIFGVQPVHLLHDLIMWLLLAFVVHHVYTAILIDLEEQSGLLSSIVTGYKSFSQHQLAQVQAEETDRHRPRRRQVRKARQAHV